MSKNSAEVIRKPLGASNKKPLVLSSSKYKKILSTIKHDEIRKKEADEEQRYKDYLKQESDNMVAKWSSSFNRSQEMKQAERNQKHEEKRQKEKQEFEKIRAKDEQIRQDKIAKAQELIQKLKPGPKELQSAAIQSETIKGRAVQRNITKEFESTLKKQSAEECLQMERQAMPWIEEEQKRITNAMQRNNQYKAEILNTVNEKSRKKAEQAKQDISEGKLAQEICDQEIKAQIEKEQDMLKRKREALRKNALEAMIMVEQRKAREQIQDTVEDKLNCLFTEGKYKIDKIKKARDQQVHEDIMKRISINGQKLAALQADNTAVEEERLRKDISTIQLQFTAQEQEKIQRSRQQKLARIQEYFRDLNAQKEQQHRKAEETRLAMATRYKNEEVNAIFEQQVKDDKLKKAVELRKALEVQIDEKKKAEAKEKEIDNKCTNVCIGFEEEDKFFFDYANNLVAEAVKKERPLYPFVKAVHQYKKDRGIDATRKLPPHLESNLRIGIKSDIPPECKKNEDPLPSPSGCSVRKYGINELKDMDPYSPRNK